MNIHFNFYKDWGLSTQERIATTQNNYSGEEFFINILDEEIKIKEQIFDDSNIFMQKKDSISATVESDSNSIPLFALNNYDGAPQYWTELSKNFPSVLYYDDNGILLNGSDPVYDDENLTIGEHDIYSIEEFPKRYSRILCEITDIDNDRNIGLFVINKEQKISPVSQENQDKYEIKIELVPILTYLIEIFEILIYNNRFLIEEGYSYLNSVQFLDSLFIKVNSLLKINLKMQSFFDTEGETTLAKIMNIYKSVTSGIEFYDVPIQTNPMLSGNTGLIEGFCEYIKSSGTEFFTLRMMSYFYPLDTSNIIFGESRYLTDYDMEMGAIFLCPTGTITLDEYYDSNGNLVELNSIIGFNGESVPFFDDEDLYYYSIAFAAIGENTVDSNNNPITKVTLVLYYINVPYLQAMEMEINYLEYFPYGFSTRETLEIEFSGTYDIHGDKLKNKIKNRVKLKFMQYSKNEFDSTDSYYNDFWGYYYNNEIRLPQTVKSYRTLDGNYITAILAKFANYNNNSYSRFIAHENSVGLVVPIIDGNYNLKDILKLILYTNLIDLQYHDEGEHEFKLVPSEDRFDIGFSNFDYIISNYSIVSWQNFENNLIKTDAFDNIYYTEKTIEDISRKYYNFIRTDFFKNTIKVNIVLMSTDLNYNNIVTGSKIKLIDFKNKTGLNFGIYEDNAYGLVYNIKYQDFIKEMELLVRI
jgi:hypothetical protein